MTDGDVWTVRHSRDHIPTASTTIIREKGDFTTIGRVPDCSVIPGNSSAEQSGQIGGAPNEIERETTSLLDTDVLSALRRRERSPDAVRWKADQRTTDLYLSVVSVGEIERGTVCQRHRDPAFARVSAAWLDSAPALYRERILAVDLSTASRRGRLSGTLGHEGANLLIAATALEHGLTVVTRNVRHFEPAGVPVLDPSAPRC